MTESKYVKFSKIVFASAIISQAGLAVLADDHAATNASATAWTLYSQHKFSAAADAFEAMIRTSPPNARLYYYAALADRECNRMTRAKQLCQYIIANFPGTTEASYSLKLYPATATAATTADAVPDALKGKNVQELMKTEEGRKMV